MKLRDWYEFNFKNNQFSCNLGDTYVKLFRSASCKKEDLIFCQLLKNDDMIELFGDYQLFHWTKETQGSYTSICVFLCKGDQ